MDGQRFINRTFVAPLGSTIPFKVVEVRERKQTQYNKQTVCTPIVIYKYIDSSIPHEMDLTRLEVDLSAGWFLEIVK